MPRRAKLNNLTRNDFELDEKRACTHLFSGLQHSKTVPVDEQEEKSVMELFLIGKKVWGKKTYIGPSHCNTICKNCSTTDKNDNELKV